MNNKTHAILDNRGNVIGEWTEGSPIGDFRKCRIDNCDTIPRESKDDIRVPHRDELHTDEYRVCKPLPKDTHTKIDATDSKTFVHNGQLYRPSLNERERQGSNESF